MTKIFYKFIKFNKFYKLNFYKLKTHIQKLYWNFIRVKLQAYVCAFSRLLLIKSWSIKKRPIRI